MLKKIIVLFVSCLIIFSESTAALAFSASSANTSYNSKLSGQLIIDLTNKNPQFSGKFLGHESEGEIYIEGGQKGTIELYVNNERVDILQFSHRQYNGVLEVNIGKFVNEGENSIKIKINGKDRTRIIVPYLTLKYGLPEEVGLNANKLNEIDKVVSDSINKGITPGAVVLVAKNGVIVKNTAYGYAQKYDMGKVLKNPRVMTTDTLFDMASVTKVMATTQAIMKLVSEGKLSVEDKVVKYIPEFGKNGKENIKIKDLLTHTSGLTPWKPTYYYVNNSRDELKYICNLPLEYPTGTKYVYSDFSFMTLGFVVERITGERLDRYVESNIYNPLGMKDSMFTPPSNLRSRIAATSWGNPYEYIMVATNNPYPVNVNVDNFKGWRHYTLVGEVNDGNSWYANGGIAGHAGLFSTAKDLAILGQTMLNGGGYDTTKIYKKSVLDEFKKPQRFGHGYGWELNQTWYMGNLHSPVAFGHTGFTGTQVIFDPQYNLQIIVLTNKQNNGLNKENSYSSTGPLSKNICNLVYQAMGVQTPNNTN